MSRLSQPRKPLRLPRNTKDKEKVRKWAKSEGRKVLWLDHSGYWHAATDRHNTPNWAVQTEDV